MGLGKELVVSEESSRHDKCLLGLCGWGSEKIRRQ